MPQILEKRSRPKPKRFIRILVPATTKEPGLLRISVGKKSSVYWFRPIPCDLEGRGFELRKFHSPVVYHVRVGQPRECDCDCLGFMHHRHCKHVEGLRSILPMLRSPGWQAKWETPRWLGHRDPSAN